MDFAFAGISQKTIASTGLVQTGDFYYSDNLAVEKYQDIWLAQADVVIENQKYDTKGRPRMVTIFDGHWLVFEFPKKFQYKLGIVSKKFKALASPRENKFEEIKTESTEFNKHFKIYAEDGFEAFYLLDPAFIARIEKFYKQHKSRPMVMCFSDNNLQVGLDGERKMLNLPRFFEGSENG